MTTKDNDDVRGSMNDRQRAKAYGLFIAHSRKDGAGFVIFDEGWSDAKILAIVQAEDPKNPINITMIERLRLRNDFGRIHARAYNFKGHTELEKLRSDVDALLEWATSKGFVR